MALAKHFRSGAGRRNRLVTIQMCSNSDPAAISGEVTPVYTNTTTRWVEMVSTAGREFLAAMQVMPMVTAIVKMRYDAFTKTITSRDRLTIGSRILNIASIANENENNETLVFWCVETAAQ